jgi:hypothetical protein
MQTPPEISVAHLLLSLSVYMVLLCRGYQCGSVGAMVGFIEWMGLNEEKRSNKGKDVSAGVLW